MQPVDEAEVERAAEESGNVRTAEESIAGLGEYPHIRTQRESDDRLRIDADAAGVGPGEADGRALRNADLQVGRRLEESMYALEDTLVVLAVEQQVGQELVRGGVRGVD